MDDNWKPKKAERLITRTEDDTLLIFDSNSGNIKVLNKTAELIWDALDGKTSVSDVVEVVVKETLDVDRQTIKNDVYKFLEELGELNFIEG
ncbi:MAG: PqqD family protein [Candidatus Methanofastidiosia archaeon]|jgi:hypothetical protein